MRLQRRESREVSSEPSDSVSQKHLVNLLNLVNFKQASVVVNLMNLVDRSPLSLRATPEPCTGEAVRLSWLETPPKDIDNGRYQFIEFLMDKGLRVIRVEGRVTDMSRASIAVILPDRCCATARRRVERFNSALVNAVVSRAGMEAKGILEDFGGGHFKLRFPVGDAALHSITRDRRPFRIILHSRNTVTYDGKATTKRYRGTGENVEVVVALHFNLDEKLPSGQETILGRPLVLIFRHPLSDRIIRLDVTKATYNSFVVNERPEHAMLFPGLIMNDAKIDLGSGDCAECTVKVVCHGSEAGTWLLSALDMPIPSQRKIFSFIERETGMSSGVSDIIDPTSLIEFFFMAGFVYPAKYASLAGSCDRLRKIVSRLYVDAPFIAQHFVRYNGGVIEAHIAMVRFYERAWVVHHHTATGGVGAGSAVLAQIFRYLGAYGALPSTGMDYLMTYYRPENRFPNKVLGGFARSLDNPRLCSVDRFAYFHLHFDEAPRDSDDKGRWQVGPVTDQDLAELNSFYDNLSGGLVLKAFGLYTGSQIKSTVDLDEEFRRAGLRRRKRIFSLRSEGRLEGVMMASDSDDGLNMSNLTKCIHLFLMNGDRIPFAELTDCLKGLSSFYEGHEIPVLIFPSSYARDETVSIEKEYDLLVVHTSVIKQFVEFVERMTNRAARRQFGVSARSREGDESGQQGSIAVPDGA